jgi:ferredoxin-NADP reductase
LQTQSGQFFRWRFLTPDLWRTAHAFSLSAAPTSTRLRLTVKALGDGSSNLQRLEAGTWVMAERPYGAITSERRTRRDVLLIAGGVGITPMRALFETMPVSPEHDLLLLYRARTADDILFHDELVHLSRRPGARLRLLLGDELGPFTPELFLGLVPNVSERDVYLCGPPRMADAVRRSLRRAGLPYRHLHGALRLLDFHGHVEGVSELAVSAADQDVAMPHIGPVDDHWAARVDVIGAELLGRR